MATINSIDSNIPIEKTKGGTQNTSFTSNAPLYYDGTKLTSVSGGATTVLTSQGAAMVPIFVNLPTFFTLLAADPGSPAPGDTWYNTTSNLFKGCKNSGGGGAWVIKAPLPTGWIGSGCSSLTGASGASAFICGGYFLADASLGAYSYDGTGDSWTKKANAPSTGPHNAGAMQYTHVLATGDPTSAFMFGGGESGSPVGERVSVSYSGGSNTWTFKANTNIAQAGASARSGTASDTLMFGINASFSTTTERYNSGSNTWTTKSPNNFIRSFPTGSGTATDALATGGTISGVYSNGTERYDGVGDSWTNKATFNLARYQAGAAGSTGGASMMYGGQNNSLGQVYTDTQVYDGVGNTWTTIAATLNQARFTFGSCGNTSDALATGGTTGATFLTSNERFMGASNTIVTFTLT